MATMGEYYRILRGQGYTVAQARVKAREWKLQETRPRISEETQALPDPVITEELRFISWRDPAPSLTPRSPRADRIRYDAEHQVIAIDWHRPGPAGPTTYYRGVPRQIWEQLANYEPSTGKFVERVLNGYNYDYDEGV